MYGCKLYQNMFIYRWRLPNMSKWWNWTVVAILLGLVLIGILGLFLDKELDPVSGKLVPIKGFEKFSTTSKTSSSIRYPMTSEMVVTVNLPPGEKFLYIIPKGQTRDLELMVRGDHAYVTVKRLPDELPRKIGIWGPGSSPYSWEAVLWIQEH